MTGYVRKDTTNNIADGNVINAADLDAEFDGVQDAFNASTGHKHDGTAGEGATINALGPTQDVTISAVLVAPKTTNTVDIGSNSLKFKDLFLAGNGSVGGTLAVTGVATFTAQPILSSLTASRAVFSDGSKGLVSNAITGTGNVVMSASPTLTGTIDAAALTASGNVTLSGGTANGVAYLNGSKVVTSGSALTFDGDTFSSSGTSTLSGSFNSTSANGTAIRIQNSSANKLLIGSVKYITGGSASEYGIGASGANPIVFATNDIERMRLDSTGLGIGTSSPSAKLQIGTGGATGLVDTVFLGGNSTDTAQFRWVWNHVGAGYLGIGTASDAYGAMIFGQASGATGAVTTEWMRIDGSGNLGLGVTPSAWLSTYRSMQIGLTSAITGLSNDTKLFLNNNAYFSASSQWVYAATSPATQYQLNDGQHRWYNAPSGTAGNAITFTQAMTLDASGNLLVGATSSSSGLTLQRSGSDSAELKLNQTGTNGRDYRIASTGTGYGSAGNLIFYDATAGAERARIDSSGNMGIGTTSPTARLSVAGNIETVASANRYLKASGWISNQVGQDSDFGASDVGIVAKTGTNLCFITGNGSTGNGNERARITSSGNFGVGTTAPVGIFDVSSSTPVLTASQSDTTVTTDMLIGAFNAYSRDLSTTSSGGVGSIRVYSEAAYNTSYTPSYMSFFTHGSSQNDGTLLGNPTERMRITSAGDVGIGTSAPNAKATIWTSSTTGLQTALRLNNPFGFANVNTGAQIVFSQDRSTGEDIPQGIIAVGQATGGSSNDSYMAFYTNSTGVTEKARITTSGNLLIGATSQGFPSSGYKLGLQSGGSQTFLSIAKSGQSLDSGGMIIGMDNTGGSIYVRENQPLDFYTNSLYRARIDESGNFMLGSTSFSLDSSPGFKYQASTSQPTMGIVVNSTASTGLSNYHHYNTNATNNGYRFYIINNGGIYNFSANNSNLSDRRQKKNIEPASAYLAKMMAIPVVTFDYIDQGEDDPGKTLGVIAQDVESVAPELVNNKGFGETPEDGVPLKSIYQTDFQYALLKCIQEQQAIIESLKARLDAANL
jgi:hypothetical protein